MATAERGGPRRPRRKPGPVAVATRRRARPVGNLLRRAAGPGSDLGPAMDPEALVQCPYDKSHQVRVSRLPYHLVKCQRNNPQVARTLATCPFNARHRVPQAKLRSHVASCPDKLQPDLPHETDTSLGNRMKQPEVPTAWQGPPCQEDWEAELEDLEDPPPFIFNVRTNDLLLPCDSGMSPGAGDPTEPPRSPRHPGK
ncbi:gametocyte-specific factor 1 isoform X3 [Calonectris borealis]|uniref:gametocyte-specific factor 1 isoform X3 n=1 Tax=Calonectris borealis TaxID=1323832 RepID=UPI003F4C3CE0